jgi:hypothetical protein
MPQRGSTNEQRFKQKAAKLAKTEGPLFRKNAVTPKKDNAFGICRNASVQVGI